MPTAFVTGATGFIGGHVALALLENGWKVRALKRDNSNLLCLHANDIHWCTGDIRNFDLLCQAMAGCEAVFHVAADYRLWARVTAEVYESNVRGTENILQAALLQGVDRVIHTSSVGALGLNRDGTPANEMTPVRLKDMVGHYKRSKFLAERKAEGFIRQGLPVIIVNPSTPVGPGDHKPTPTGKIIVDFLNGKMPAYLNTGLNLVHVRDVARGHLLALEQGKIGQKYILGNQNLTLAEIFSLLQQISNIPAPRFRLPYRPVFCLACINEVVSRMTGAEPLIPFEGVKMANRYMFFDPSKAVLELGLPQTPVTAALEEAVTWYMENGYVKKMAESGS
ncbi:MAG: NAD-dependent epimerase/dehydratase family protein [Desulforhabdus sp.]|jgi:dihydroflavonol-4-reductase|nr:NAD-dependent epimerase/dehydratase family protein [Desulforhabdus sp.]